MLPIEIVRNTFQITAFVAVMMVAVEYLNILSRGLWGRVLASSHWVQYPIAILLGATPGCLGAFAIVALYSHRMVSLGAVVGCMIATSGDEAFVMLALFPGKALLLTLGLACVGLGAAVLTDLFSKETASTAAFHDYPLHAEDDCHCFPTELILGQLRRLSPARGLLGLGIGLFIVAVIAGAAGPPVWSWVRWTFLLTGGFGLFVILTVPDHFLDEHLWRHIVLQHVPRILLWTFGALVTMAVVEHFLPEAGFGPRGRWAMLGAAGLFGLIPESGPHLLFVTMYDRGIAPLSILVTSSIVQDGHGMLPLLAHSRLDFLKVKAINLAAGLLAGALLLALGL